jgi:hypothetical protein
MSELLPDCFRRVAPLFEYGITSMVDDRGLSEAQHADFAECKRLGYAYPLRTNLSAGGPDDVSADPGGGLRHDNRDPWTGMAVDPTRPQEAETGALRVSFMREECATTWWLTDEGTKAWRRYNQEQPPMQPASATGPQASPQPPTAVSPEPNQYLRRVGEVWDLRYGDELFRIAVDRCQFVSWLAKLLVKPNYAWLVTELRGDPEGKLKADAAIRNTPAMDDSYVQAIRRELEDIEAQAAATSWTEALEERRDRCVRKLTPYAKREHLKSPARAAFENVSKQSRNFLANLGPHAPRLAEHFRRTIVLGGQSLSVTYSPPPGTPAWLVEEK